MNALNFNKSGSKLASGSDDLKIMLWDWTDGAKKPLVEIDSGHRNNVFQAKFMPNCDDTTIVSAARDGQVCICLCVLTAAYENRTQIIWKNGLVVVILKLLFSIKLILKRSSHRIMILALF